MRPRLPFAVSLTAFLALFATYGLHRMTLGVDFTDEGAYLAWPMRMLFGERPFTSELMTLIKPVEVYLSVLFRIHPGMTLYEFRLLGWGLHLTAFGFFAAYLFRLGAGAWLAPLIASLPFFVCHVFGLAPPSYNTLSSDFLLLALALFGFCRQDEFAARWKWGAGAGLALFLATFAHPGLGLVGALLLAWEFWRHDLARNLAARRPTASNTALLVFVSGWAAFAVYFAASGGLADWRARISLTSSFAVSSFNDGPVNFLRQLARFPFAYTPQAEQFTVAGAGAVVLVFFGARFRHGQLAWVANGAMALLVAALPLAVYRSNGAYLTDSLAQATLLGFAGWLAGRKWAGLRAESEILLLVTLSLVAALTFGTLTYNFGPHRSWISGILGLPFAFGTIVTLLLRTPARRPWLFQVPAAVLLLAGTQGAAEIHYRSIYRDAAPEELTTPYHLPKLNHLKSTAERVAAVEALHAYLAPKLTRGEPLLAYDNCPMLYYLFDARPAYGLAWATRYSMSPAALAQLNREFQAGPLPRYAIRTIVALQSSVWATAPKTDYGNYALNETMLAHYELERTIFPFEIWRLKSAPTP